MEEVFSTAGIGCEGRHDARCHHFKIIPLASSESNTRAEAMAIGLELANNFSYEIPQRSRLESKHCNRSLSLRAKLQLVTAKLIPVGRFLSVYQQ